MHDAIRTLLARNLPGLEVHQVSELGHGVDNVVYEVDGDIVVRRSREPDPESRRHTVQREADLLAAVAAWSTLPVPQPVFVDPDAGVLAYTKLPGAPLLTHPVADPLRLGAPLGEFTARLHTVPAGAVAGLVERDIYPMEQWRKDAERDYLAVVEHIPASARPAIEDFLARTPPPDADVVAFCHNDLGAEHLLVDVATAVVTGVIDWTDAALADPMRDLALIRRDLGPEVLDAVVTHHDVVDDAARARIDFYARCAVLEDIAYGTQTGRRPYAEAGLEHLSWTFG